MKGVWKSSRHYMTLMEIMIVMALIAMILGVLAFNYQGALDDGRAFETKANIEKIRTVVNLRMAQDPSAVDDMSSKWKDYLRSSPLITDPEKSSKDGWGEEFKVSVDEVDGNKIISIKSSRLEAYEKSRK